MDQGLEFVKPRKGDKVRCPWDDGEIHDGVVLQASYVKEIMRVEFATKGKVWVDIKHGETFVVIWRKVRHFFCC